MASKTFDPNDFSAFLKLLPASVDGVPHSFDDPAFLAMARGAGVAVVLADHADYPAIIGHDVGFSYMRLMRTQADEPTGYAPADLDRWADRIGAQSQAGDVFAFFISGAKARNRRRRRR